MKNYIYIKLANYYLKKTKDMETCSRLYKENPDMRDWAVGKAIKYYYKHLKYDLVNKKN